MVIRCLRGAFDGLQWPPSALADGLADGLADDLADGLADDLDDDLADGLADGLPHQTLTTTLIKHGANLELRSDEHFTALHVGCVLGHAGCVRLLVAAAADVHARATLGATPLILAAR